MIDFDNLEKMIAEKYISRQKHPTLDLYIHNYTQKAQFDRVWNNETLQSRGLILDNDNRVVSRPFRKFFNLGEILNGSIAGFVPDTITTEGDFTVTEKMDGSLGISYFDPDGKMYIATRGSFVSDQAKKANEIWVRKYSNGPTYPHHTHTFLFEIIYPANRIVVDYGKTEDLVLLTVINTKTGIEVDYEELTGIAKDHNMPVVQQFDGIIDFTDIVQKPNSEGYVVHFPTTGLRFKVKFEEYVRLHKIVTGVNAKRVWEFLKEGQPLDSFLDRVPDEFYQWITKTSLDLKSQYRVIENAAIDVFTSVQDWPIRKDQAIAIKDSPYRAIVFSMLDGKPYEHKIWNMIEPEFERPFKAVDESVA